MTTTTPTGLKLPSMLPGSDMAGVHKSAGPLRRALIGIPEWVATVEKLTFLESIRPPRRNPAPLDVEMSALLDAAVEARKPLDLDAAAAHARAVQDQLAVHQAMGTAFEVTARAYVADLDAAVHGNKQAIYTSLSEQVADIVNRGRACADMLEADAEAAIDAGRVEQWQEAQALRTEFAGLRSAYNNVRNKLGFDVSPWAVYSELLWFKNPAEVFEHWRAWRVDGALIDPQNTADRKPLQAPWPDPANGHSAGDAVERWFSYLVRTSDAEPWTPSPRQYDDAASELSKYAAGHATSRHGGTRKAVRVR